MTNTKTESTLIDFSFEQDVTEKDLKKIAKKVATVCKNSEYDSVVSYFTSRNNIQVIITFIDTDNKIFDKMRSPITRLIDSHKEPATFEWSLDSRAVQTLVVA